MQILLSILGVCRVEDAVVSSKDAVVSAVKHTSQRLTGSSDEPKQASSSRAHKQSEPEKDEVCMQPASMLHCVYSCCPMFKLTQASYKGTYTVPRPPVMLWACTLDRNYSMPVAFAVTMLSQVPFYFSTSERKMRLY